MQRWAILPSVTAALLAMGCSAELDGDDRDSDSGSDGPGGETAVPDDPDDPYGETAASLEEVGLGSPLVRRLTKDELRYTLGDTFGIDISEDDVSEIPADRPLEGFVNVATSQTVLPDHVTAYWNLSADFVTRLNWDGLLAQHAPCTESTTECEAGFISSLGRVLFRGPLEQQTIDAFTALFAAVLEEDGADFQLGADAVVQAMLQSPQFLYRIEKETADANGLAPGAERLVDGHEMATRLSYLVWASAPDDELLRSADAGELSTIQGVAAQLARLLQDTEKAKRVTGRYIRDWGRLAALPDDGGLKPELVSSLIGSYNHMLWNADVGPLDALSHHELMLTGTLAENYGLTKTGDELALYDVSDAEGRVGLLTHPGLIAGMTNADGGAIVARGLFLQTQLFCQETPSPPTAVQDAIDEFKETLPDDASDRYIAETRLERTECGSCHGGFDPLAYGFERFDYQGRFRDQDEHGNELSTDGWIPYRVRIDDDQDEPYSTLEEYSELLAAEPAVSSCITLQHLKYALGRVIHSEAAAQQIQTEFNDRGRSFNAMLESIASHKLFRTMKVE